MVAPCCIDALHRQMQTQEQAHMEVDIRASIREIRNFADSEADRSGLPGLDQGPADAYRHLIGVAEMARRFRVGPAAAMAEYNEFRSWRAMRQERSAGRLVSESNTPEARAMDRHNNRIATWIGTSSSSPEDVVRRVRTEMERAIRVHGGSGENHTPSWRESRYWSEGEPITRWSSWDWPDIESSEHFRTYRSTLGAREEVQSRRTGGGPVQVSPHMRDGYPVSGHTRATPSR